VGRLTAKRLEDHHLERAGKQIAWMGFRHNPVHYRHRLNRYEEIVKADSTIVRQRLCLQGKARFQNSGFWKRGLAIMHQLKIVADEMCLAVTTMDQVRLPYSHGRPDKHPTAYCSSTRFQSQSIRYSGYETGGVPLSMKV
jgi:hypothetical protein